MTIPQVIKLGHVKEACRQIRTESTTVTTNEDLTGYINSLLKKAKKDLITLEQFNEYVA